MNALTEFPGTEAKFWDKIAEKYARQPVQDPSAFERKIAITRELMSPSDAVLDIGCGTGSLALRLAPSAREVHGLDFSREMLRIARDKARALGASNVRFHLGTLESAPFEPGRLDGITAYSLLHLVQNRREALEQIHHLLRPGGFFVSSTLCLAESRIPYGGILSAMRLFGQAPMVRILSVPTVVEEIRSAGFTDVECLDVGAKKEIAFVVARKGRA